MGLITKLFGTYSERQVKKLIPTVDKIEALADKYKAMTDAEMRAMTDTFKEQLAGGHSDDTAFTVSEDYGWGWLADRGFDFIQTDWPMMLIDYLKRTDKYFK